MFNIEFSNQSKKFIKKCDSSLRNRLIERIDSLKTDPVPHKAVRVVGEERTFRIRVGDYRVLYEIKWGENIILIAKIDKRPKAYD